MRAAPGLAGRGPPVATVRRPDAGGVQRGDRLRPASEDHPDLGALILRTAAVVAEQDRKLEAGLLEPAHHLWNRERAERQREAVHACAAAEPFRELLIEDGQS